MSQSARPDWKKYVQKLVRKARDMKWGRLSELLLEAYATLSGEERKGVEKALIEMLLDDDEHTSLDSIVLVNDLYLHGNPSPNFRHQVVRALETIISRDTLRAKSPLAYEIIGSLNTFQVKNAIPFLKQYIDSLEEERIAGYLPEKEYGLMLGLSWRTLASLDLDAALPVFHLLLEHDRRSGNARRLGESGYALAVLWEHYGINGIQSLLSDLSDADRKTREAAYTQMHLALDRLCEDASRGVREAPAKAEKDKILHMTSEVLALRQSPKVQETQSRSDFPGDL